MNIRRKGVKRRGHPVHQRDNIQFTCLLEEMGGNLKPKENVREGSGTSYCPRKRRDGDKDRSVHEEGVLVF